MGKREMCEFQEKNFQQMMETLRPLHERIESGHTTMKEESFNQASPSLS